MFHTDATCFTLLLGAVVNFVFIYYCELLELVAE